MKILIKNPGDNAVTLLRRAGYAFQRREGEETSFVRTFGRSGFPRFHCYVKAEDGNIVINMHLDRKGETYGDSTRHHGEYGDEGPLAEEGRRLIGLFGPGAEILA
jgi:hypothetical protein